MFPKYTHGSHQGWKMENLEKWESTFQSGNFDQSGKVRENVPKIMEKSGNFDTGKLEKNTGKARDICQLEKENTMKI